MNLRVFVAEPEELRRRMIRDLADEAADITLVGETASLVDAEPEVVSTDADIFLINATLVSSELDALHRLADQHSGAYFVLFDSHPDLETLLNSADLPIRGFLSFNHLSTEEFTRSMDVIAHGGAVIEPLSAHLLLQHLRALAPAAARPGANASLTTREREVLELVTRGLSNKEIARQMSISLGTVRAHLRNIFRKLDVTSRASAAVSSMNANPPRAVRPID